MPARTDIIDRMAPGEGAAFLRLRSLGDCVLSTPAIRLLKQHRPDLRIAVVVEDRFRDIFDANPDISAVIPPRARDLRAFRPVLCLNLHGGTRSARLTLLSAARFRAGFDIFRPAWIYNTPIPAAQEILGVERAVHTAEHAASAVFYLGVPITAIPRATIPAAPGPSTLAPCRSYAVIHPFAATSGKTWPAARFVELARVLDQSLELEPVFVGAPGDDFAPFLHWRTIMGAPLAEIARLMRDAALFIGNDSGPAHIAAAFGVPEVVLFGASQPETWGPWRTQSEIIRGQNGIGSIPLHTVIAAIERVGVRTG